MSFTELDLLADVEARWGSHGAHADLVRWMVAEVTRLRAELDTLRPSPGGVPLGDRPDVRDVLDLADALEALASRVEALDSGRAEKFVARRLLVDAAAAARGAARQIDLLGAP